MRFLHFKSDWNRFMLTFLQAIEERENLKRAKRINNAVFEQELLRYNPVNWSQTLR